MSTLTLREQRTSLVVEARKILDKEESLSAESQETYDKIMAQVDSLAEQIKTEERKEHQAKVEAELKEPAKRSNTNYITQRTDEGENRAFNTWVRRAAGVHVSANQVAEAEQYISLHAKEYNVNLAQRSGSGLTVGSNAGGGYLVPTLIPAQVERFMKYFAPMRNWVRVERTMNGDTMKWPTVDFTTQLASIVSEAGTVGENDPTFGSVTLGAYKFAGKILISQELMTDAVIDLVPVISSGLGEVIGRGQEVYFETGTGSSQPTGLVTAATSAGSTVFDVGTLTFDNVMDLIYGVDRVYQKDLALFGSNKTLLALRKVKDSYGRYVWGDFINPVTNAIEERINGLPFHVCNSMHDYASGANGGSGSGGGGTPFLVAAVPSLFMIRDVRVMDISVNPYLYQATGQVAVFANLRSDSNYLGPTNSIAFLTSN